MTEADTEQEAFDTRAQSEAALAASQEIVLPAESASAQNLGALAVEEAKN